MADDDTRLRQQAQLTNSGLVVLLARAGGSATFTEAEYQQAAEQYGGLSRLAIHAEVVRDGDRAPYVRLALVRKDPANAELVS